MFEFTPTMMMDKLMRFFYCVFCFAFLMASVQADDAVQNEMHPEAFVKRSYVPTYAEIILARSTGRPYVRPQVIEEPQKVVEAPKPSPIPTFSPKITEPISPSKEAVSKDAFSTPNTIPGLESEILKRIKQYDIYIRHYSRIHELDPNLVRAMIYVESAGDPNAVSVDGAMGLMQLMPGTADDMGVKSPHEPAQNIFGGTRYMSRMMERFGSLDLALWAYNAGPELVKRKRLPLETRRYIPKVLRIKRQLDEGL